MTPWFVYLLRTKRGALYAGITTDVARRIAEHEGGGKGRGAKFLRAQGPLALAYEVEVPSREVALQVEHRIKRLPKSKKETIVRTAPSREELFSLLGMPGAS